MVSYGVFVYFLLIGSALAVEFEFSYDAQDVWPGICVANNNMRQSPINIGTDDVEENDDLIPLELSDAWATTYSGTFNNMGHNVQVNPNFTDATGPATTNHIGTYDLLQCHVHWGNMSGVGSEHLIDGYAADLEIHFVHRMQGATDDTAGDYLAVVAVLADVDEDEDAPLTGPWLLLNASAVQEFESSIPITGFSFDSLLPVNRDYYYYQGSLTTPPCSETVQWFVLKERITVPGKYLEQLRQIEETDQGDILTFNFRMPQALGPRVVTANSQATLKPFISILTFCLVTIKLF